MLKRILKIFNANKTGSGPLIIEKAQHGIDKSVISRNAIKVVEGLQAAGYTAYIVGGGVRDTLLDTKPKDFDVATDATPEQVKGVFRNAMLIGRRFKIVHVRFGREIIEVTTFRAHHEEAKSSRQAEQSDQGVLLRDNVYGDIESDAIRRDFTVNALYYDPTSDRIFDFTNGLKDLSERKLKIIGEPEDRYREDPVRMLRAVRFAAKLGFTIDDASGAPIHSLANLLSHIPPARLFEEILKLMLGGSATATVKLLREYALFEELFPGTASCLKEDLAFDQELIQKVCINTDKRIRLKKRVTPAFIYAVFLWLPLQRTIAKLIKEDGYSVADANQVAAQRTISAQLQRTSIPKRFLIPMRDIWSLQHRFTKRERKRVFSLTEHKRFRAAYDFLILREEAGEDLEGLGQWWTQFQEVSPEQKDVMLSEAAKQNPRRKTRKPRRKKPKGDAPQTTN